MNTEEIILAQFPGRVLIPLIDAGKAIGYKEQTCYNMHHRGRFPLRVRMQGRKPMVAISDLILYVTNEESPPAAPAEQTPRRRVGRPRNADRN